MSRGRYAPSPTGEIHLGNAATALLAWLSIRSQGGGFVMRMEDLDRGRSRPDLPGQILRDLRWLGLDWDEGPDRGGPHAPYDQHPRGRAYEEAFLRLRASRRLYACFCSRKDIRSAASAPQEPGEEVRYPGTCLELDEDEAARRLRDGVRHAWRFRVERDDRSRFLDLLHGPCEADPPGDFVVRRSDGVPAYHLAVVVDDAAMAIDEVVRGDDLLSSTGRQLLLVEALGLEPPVYGHVPLLLGPDGVRLSKRHRGTTLRELRELGLPPERVVGRLAHVAGLLEQPTPVTPEELVGSFAWERLRKAPRGIVVDASDW